MFTRTFAIAAFERAIRTFAQALGAILLADGTGLLDSDWAGALSASGMAALLAVLTSVAAGAVNSDNSPAITDAEQLH